MESILGTSGIVLPLFALIFVGWAAGALKLLPDASAEGLSDYVFNIAVPVLIFNAVTAQADSITVSPWPYWIAYFTGAFASFAIGMIVATQIWGREWIDGAIQGFASGQSNVVFVGVPVILAAFGPAGQAPMLMLLAIHMPVMTITAMLVAESEKLSLSSFVRAGRSIATNPIFVGIVLGAIAHLLGYVPSGFIAASIDRLSASATPCGLIALGLVLRRQGAIASLPQVGLTTFVKLAVHPLLVLGACLLLGVTPVWAKVAVTFAAMPCGMNAFLMAQKYRRSPVVSAAAITVSTLVSLPTIAIWLAIVQLPGLFPDATPVVMITE